MNKKYILAAILVMATLLRVINLSAGDLTGSDEVFYAFRAIGPLDFDNSISQPSPLQWLDPNIPWWTNLSMHDHPLLVFVVQHISMGIFGENNFGFRFPSAVLGVLSVYLVYLLAKKLFSEKTGLIAAALTTVTVNHVYISRIGLQESYVIFFLLLASCLFLRALDQKKYFLWTGAALGLAFLTKYICFIAVPIFLTYLLIFRRDVFRLKQFWLGITLAVLVASPILIYNFNLYRAVGHFDFQLSYLFGQNPKVWPVAPGKEQFPTALERVKFFLPNLVKTNSLLFLGLFGLSTIYGLRRYLKNPRETFRQRAFLEITLGALIIFILLVIGPAFRFLTILTPFLAIAVADFLANLKISKKLALGGLALILSFETAYAVNSEVTNYPIGPKLWAFSQLRYDTYNWGFNELDRYLNEELAGRMPAATFDLRYQFLERFKQAALKNARQRGDTPYPAIFIFDGNLHTAAQLWILARRQIYHGWPTVNAEIYLKAPQKPVALNNYFILPTENLPLKKGQQTTIFGAQLEQQLLSSGVYPETIKNKRGEEVFRIYKFSM